MSRPPEGALCRDRRQQDGTNLAGLHAIWFLSCMEFLLGIAGIWALVTVCKKVFGAKSNPAPQGQTSQQSPRRESNARSTAPQSSNAKDVYRPRSGNKARPSITFDTPSQAGPTGPLPSQQALEGLHDAFTGAPLKAALGLHQCNSCKVYYHAPSVEVLRQENGMRCVACGNSSIVALSESQTRTTRGRDYSPDVVTLANFRSHFDRVVTFEGRVHAVRVSRRGSDFAVMFENASWTRGLKLVFFRGAIKAVGGAEFIDGLSGKTVRVRGLLINHSRFGPEIIISERSMILAVS